MTSTANQPSIPAQSTTPTATSYASAAGVTKPSSSSPRIASESDRPPVVVGSSTSQNGKPATLPVNGRPNIPPAVPAMSGPPTIARGSSSNVNGGPGDHSRKSSVTFSAPQSTMANGSALGAQNNIKFGFQPSPSTTPQISNAAPVGIPVGNAAPPAMSSPRPIPQALQQSGGPRSAGQRMASGQPPVFGSFPDESRMPPHNAAMMASGPPALHNRRESAASAQGDGNVHVPPSHVRGGGGFGGAGRGGRGGYNQSYGNTGFPPNRSFTGPNNGGRGNMPFQPRGGMQQYPANSPQATRASPAMSHATMHQPGGTPTMAPAMMAPQMASNPQFYPPNMTAMPNMNMGMYPQPVNGPVQYPAQYDSYGRPIMYPYGQQAMPYLPQGPPQPAPGPYPNQFSSYPQPQPSATPMSRNSSQVSEQRPASSTGPSQPPVIAQGTPQSRVSQQTPPIASSSTFSRPKKSSAIVIKNAEGKVVDLSQIKAPPSPVPNIQQSKTPPVRSTPTPPPKSSTPQQHTRGESTSGSKTAEQLRNEFKDAVRKTAAEVPADTKAKGDEPAKPSTTETVGDADKEPEKEADKEPERQLEIQPEQEPKAITSDSKAQDTTSVPAPPEEATKAEPAATPATEAKETKSSPDDMGDDDEIERMIREMEEADRKREEEQAKVTAKKEAEKAEAKKKEDTERLARAADNDRKLREQEAEMERLEEERERQRNEREAKGTGAQANSISDLLSKKLDDLKTEDTEKASTPTSEPSSASGTKAPFADKQRSKPVPLNLTPINTKPVEAPQPSAAVQALKSARFLDVIDPNMYPPGINSPNPALNTAVSKKGKSFRYDAKFLLQFQDVFTDQPSSEFLQQVKSLISDSEGGRSTSTRGGAGGNRQNPRPGAPAGFPQQAGSFGSFGAGGSARTLPPGTTSAQRFEMTRPPLNSIGSFGSGRGGFPGSTGHSARGNSNALPSPTTRTSSKRGERGPSRNATQRGQQGAAADRNMPLTQGMDLKPIAVSEKGWKPTSITNKPVSGPGAIIVQQGNLDAIMVQRKVKAALNKMTPEKFDRIADQILDIASQSKNETDGRTLRQVIQLTFEKATDEAHWASMYAKFCKRMLDTMSPEIRDESLKDKNGNVIGGGALFRKYLLNRCQEDFERGWKVEVPEAKEGEDKKPQEAALLSDEYYVVAAAKRRGLGLVQFIGELFKLGMLTERIMHACVHKLLEFEGMPEEAEVESLTKLLRTVGPNLDQADKGSAQNKGPAMMEAYFKRINQIVEMPDLPSRLKFMLMDVIDLRRANWASKDSALKGPKTLDEIRQEAEKQAAQKAAETARGSQRGGAPGGRMPAGRGDARNFSSYNPAPNTVATDDLRRLKVTGSNRSSSQNLSFGPTSMFASRSSSGRKLGPTNNFARGGGEDSNSSSRVGTPPVRDRESSVAHTNAFGLLADTGDHPASPPSAAASPAITQSQLAGGDKQEN